VESEVERETEPGAAETLQKKILTRAELLALSSELVEQLHARTTRPTFRETGADRTRLAYARATTAAIAATAAILRDAELDDLKERLDRLEERKGCTCKT